MDLKMVFMDYIFCISEKNKFIMLLCIALLQSCSFNERTSGNILLQNNEQSSIVVDIKRIAVCLGQLADRDSVPVSIIFFVSVNNQTDHNFIFDSSTDFYFREIADKRYGEFWMIHSRDSLMLSSHMLGVPIVKSRNSIMFDPQINDIDYSNRKMELLDFLLKIPVVHYEKYIYDYISNSKFIYRPIVKDYQEELQGLEDKGIKVDYPQFCIEVKKMMPLVIEYIYNCSDFEEENNNNNYYYYYEDTLLVERFWGRIEEWTSNTLYRLTPWNEALKIDRDKIVPFFSLGYTIVYDE